MIGQGKSLGLFRSIGTVLAPGNWVYVITQMQMWTNKMIIKICSKYWYQLLFEWYSIKKIGTLKIIKVRQNNRQIKIQASFFVSKIRANLFCYSRLVILTRMGAHGNPLLDFEWLEGFTEKSNVKSKSFADLRGFCLEGITGITISKLSLFIMKNYNA